MRGCPFLRGSFIKGSTFSNTESACCQVSSFQCIVLDLALCSLLQAMQEYYRGEYEQSERTNKTAKNWAIGSIVSGVIVIVGVIFFCIVVQAVVYGVVFTRPR